ncbi:IclR family transcriptional regulator [Emcibacteraceae bacterium]|nr:IclR family transcriptional regulator [Emcibacteraceae bacterium]
MLETLHKNHERYFVPGLDRGLRVLEIVAKSDRPLTIAEIAKKLDVSRSSAFRITYTLSHLGFLITDSSNKLYDLGPRVLSLGFSYLNGQDIIKIAKPHLEKLRDITEISSHLAIREGSEVLYLDNIVSKSPFVSNISRGERRPIYASPLGWVLLGDMLDPKIIELFNNMNFQKMTDHTPGNVSALIARIREARTLGHVVSRGYVQHGGSTITAPIFDETNAVAAVIDISGPDSGFNFDKIDNLYVPAVVDAAQNISRDLGFSG